MEIVAAKDESYGIYIYKNMLTEDLDLVNRIENLLSTNDEPSNGFFSWQEALVGDKQKMPEYRDCNDFKVGQQVAENPPPEYSDLKGIFFDVKDRLDLCVDNYQKRYNIKMEYMEAINFIRYTENQHFQVHADHGFSYICTVSSVMYLNDDYEGGELWFPNLDLKIKPEYGDIVLFPSTYIYAHAALPVKSGIKYSAVTMFDYNDRAHGPHMEQAGKRRVL